MFFHLQSCKLYNHDLQCLTSIMCNIFLLFVNFFFSFCIGPSIEIVFILFPVSQPVFSSPALGNQTCIPDFTHAECNNVKNLLLKCFTWIYLNFLCRFFYIKVFSNRLNLSRGRLWKACGGCWWMGKLRRFSQTVVNSIITVPSWLPLHYI